MSEQAFILDLVMEFKSMLKELSIGSVFGDLRNKVKQFIQSHTQSHGAHDYLGEGSYGIVFYKQGVVIKLGKPMIFWGEDIDSSFKMKLVESYWSKGPREGFADHLHYELLNPITYVQVTRYVIPCRDLDFLSYYKEEDKLLEYYRQTLEEFLLERIFCDINRNNSGHNDNGDLVMFDY